MRDWEFALAGFSERHVQPSSGRLWVHGCSVGDKGLLLYTSLETGSPSMTVSMTVS